MYSVLKLLASGLVDYWASKQLSPDWCEESRATDPVTLQDLTYVLIMVFGSGLGIGIAVLLFEILVNRIKWTN